MERQKIFTNTGHNFYVLLECSKKRGEYSKDKLKRFFYDNIYSYISIQIENIKTLIDIGINLGQLGAEDYPKFFPSNYSYQFANEEFFRYVRHFTSYAILFNDNDYLKIYSNNDNVKYNRYQNIMTNCIKRINKVESCGREFNYWNEFIDVSYRVMVNENYNLNPEIAYSLDLIQNLVNEGKIVVTDIYEKSLSPNDYKVLDYRTEMYDNFYYTFENDLICKLLDEKHRYHKTFISYFFRCIDKEFLQVSIDSCINNIKSVYKKPSKYAYNEFCKKGFATKFLSLKSKKETVEFLINFEKDNNFYDYLHSQLSRYWDIMEYVNYDKKLHKKISPFNL